MEAGFPSVWRTGGHRMDGAPPVHARISQESIRISQGKGLMPLTHDSVIHLLVFELPSAQYDFPTLFFFHAPHMPGARGNSPRAPHVKLTTVRSISRVFFLRPLRLCDPFHAPRMPGARAKSPCPACFFFFHDSATSSRYFGAFDFYFFFSCRGR